MKEIRFDIPSLHAAYAEGLPAASMVEAVFERITEVADPGIFIQLADKASVLNEVAALGAFEPSAKPLWGVPFAVKDNIDVEGMPTTAACPAFAYSPGKDAAVVALIKAAGAIVIGKTNLDQFATGLVGVRSPYPIPRNAVDPTLVPGGSSSGSAVAVAQDIVSFSLGTDTAGSGRIPAGLNNLVGLKPSVGALSASGVVPACRTLDCVSIFAKTVDDAYRVLAVAARHDPSDAYSRSIPVLPLSPRPPAFKVGVPAKADRKFFGDKAMEDGFDTALAALEGIGCRIEELPFRDFYGTANLLYEGAWVAERYAAISGFMTAHEADMHPVTAKIIGGARRLSAADAFKGLYALQGYKSKLAPVIASVDMICVPTAPTHYTVDDVLADPIGTNSRLGTYTNFVNLLDLCGMAVPTGTRDDGRPMSITLLAPAGKDHLVASLARDIQGRTRLSPGRIGSGPPSERDTLAPKKEGTIELVVIGAHLSGMPLNHQLQGIDARFHRCAKTKATYRLFALAGQSVPKPGLIRTANGGHEIDVEVWGLSPDAFGRFVAAIPPPLGIGTILLNDGTSAKGFLVETAGLSDATDITSYGGWRNFIETTPQSA